LSSTTQNETQYPGNIIPIIPDGQGGVLATWSVSPLKGAVPQYPYQAVDVVAGVVGTLYNLPFSPQAVDITKQPDLVLGENGVAFVKGQTTATVNGVPTTVDEIISFNLGYVPPNLGPGVPSSPNWTYQAASGLSLSLIMSTAGNGLLAKSTDQNGNDTSLTFDSLGDPPIQGMLVHRSDARNLTPNGQQSGVSQIDYYADGVYLGIQSGGPVSLAGSISEVAAAPGTRPSGDAQHNGTTDPGLVLVAFQDCHLVDATTQGGTVWGRIPRYYLRSPAALLQPLQCSSSPPPTSQNSCYTVFEYIPELESSSCTVGDGWRKNGEVAMFLC
jgi:hypothetical protein